MRGFRRSFLQLGLCGLLVAAGLSLGVFPAFSAPSPFPDDLTCQALPGHPAASLCYRQPAMSNPDWFLLSNGRLQTIFLNTYGPQVAALSFSPSGQLLAVTTTGEGHPLLDLSSQGSWDPYPGWLNIAGWFKETLLFQRCS
jgi:hypothetical protein